MDSALLDRILTLQLAIARLGEKDCMNWWAVKIAHQHSGADFLERLVGPEMAVLAVGDGLLQAAALAEQEILKKIPGEAVFTIFHPEPELLSALSGRFRHYKRYPASVPESVRSILDPTRKMDAVFLFAETGAGKAVKYTGTTFGREITLPKGQDPETRMRALASVLGPDDRGAYPLPYYRCS